MIAVTNGDTKMTELLLAAGAAADDSNTHTSLSVLHMAVKSGNVDIVRMLLAHGARVDRRDNAGQTPLDYAAGDPVMTAILRTPAP